MAKLREVIVSSLVSSSSDSSSSEYASDISSSLGASRYLLRTIELICTLVALLFILVTCRCVFPVNNLTTLNDWYALEPF